MLELKLKLRKLCGFSKIYSEFMSKVFVVGTKGLEVLEDLEGLEGEMVGSRKRRARFSRD